MASKSWRPCWSRAQWKPVGTFVNCCQPCLSLYPTLLRVSDKSIEHGFSKWSRRVFFFWFDFHDFKHSGGGQGAHLIHALWSLPTSCMLLPCQTRKWFLGARPWTPFWSKPCIAQHRRIDASPLWKKLTPKPKTFAIHCHQHVQPTFLYVLNDLFWHVVNMH